MRALEKIKRIKKILDRHLREQRTEQNAASLSNTGQSHLANGNALDGKTVYERLAHRMDSHERASALTRLQLTSVENTHTQMCCAEN